MKVIFTEQAEQDLEDIGDWIARGNPSRAASFVIELRAACQEIGGRPRGYPVADSTRDPTLRRRVYGSYLIFYDIGAAAVEILHILHGARDYGRIVFPDALD